MYNPRFDEVNKTVRYIVGTYHDYLQEMKVTWKELKDEDGDVYQIVPLYHVTFK